MIELTWSSGFTPETVLFETVRSATTLRHTVYTAGFWNLGWTDLNSNNIWLYHALVQCAEM